MARPQRLAKLVLGAALALPGCGSGEREIVVTREQLGEDWPLAVNSAKVVCAGERTRLKVGIEEYALNEAARAEGYPDAREVAMRDTEPLRAVCDAPVAAER